jgi:hypothetical protein
MGLLIARAAAIAFAALSIVSAQAYGVRWTGAGWYVVDDNPGGLVLFLGPIADEAACNAVRPPDEEYAIFECKYFQERPNWDN